jgi:hypothetical protein
VVSFVASLLPSVATSIHDAHPRCRVRDIEAEPEECFDLLLADDADVAVVLPIGCPIVQIPLTGNPAPSRHILTGIRRGSAQQPMIAWALATLSARAREQTRQPANP